MIDVGVKVAGLALLAQVVAIVIRNIRGGGRFGYLSSEVKVPLEGRVAGDVMALVRHRAESLGFLQDASGRFIQGGNAGVHVMPRLPEVYTHSNTKKSIQFREENDCIAVTFKYETLIVADTGEVAFRDATLAFVAGERDDFAPAPNVSLLADSSVISVVFGLIGMLLLWERSFAEENNILIGSLFMVGMLGGLWARRGIRRSQGRIVGERIASIGIWSGLAGFLGSMAGYVVYLTSSIVR